LLGETHGLGGGVETATVDRLGGLAVALAARGHLLLLALSSRGAGPRGPSTGWPPGDGREVRGPQSVTVIPIDRAVPAMILAAASRSRALRSTSFCCAISRTCSWLSEATLTVCGAEDPCCTPAAFLISSGAGGVLVVEVTERSAYAVTSTGMPLPRCDSVAALYGLQNSMMLTLCCPSAGPIGGAGLAAPSWIWSLMRPTAF